MSMETNSLTLLHSEWPKLYGVLAILSAIGLISEWSQWKVDPVVITKERQKKKKQQNITPCDFWHVS